MFTIMVKKRPGWINSFQTYLTFGYFPISRKSSFKLDFQYFGHQKSILIWSRKGKHLINWYVGPVDAHQRIPVGSVLLMTDSQVVQHLVDHHTLINHHHNHDSDDDALQQIMMMVTMIQVWWLWRWYWSNMMPTLSSQPPSSPLLRARLCFPKPSNTTMTMTMTLIIMTMAMAWWWWR